MRISTAINVLHWLLTAALAAFIWLNYQPDPRASDRLQNVRQVSPAMWLYTTENSDGGTTVPSVFRYYLRDTADADMHQLIAATPFLTGTGSISAITIEGDRVNIDFSGKVYGIEQRVDGYSLSYSIR